MYDMSKRITVRTPAVIRVKPSYSFSVKYHINLSTDPKATASDLGDTDVALRERLQATLFDWIQTDNRLYAVGLRDLSKLRNQCLPFWRTHQQLKVQMRPKMTYNKSSRAT